MRAPLRLAAAALALAGCGVSLTKGGGETLGSAGIERFLVREFAGAPVTGVTCPGAEDKGGTPTFECRATIMDVEVTLVVQETGEDRYGRVEAVIEVAIVETFVQQQYDQQVGVPVLADCAPAAVIVRRPGDAIECVVVDSQGTTETASVTVDDVEGNISLDLGAPA